MTGTLREAVEEILRTHVPEEDTPHWANERKCHGCDRFIHIIIEGFKRHQAELITEEVRNRLGCR